MTLTELSRIGERIAVSACRAAARARLATLLLVLLGLVSLPATPMAVSMTPPALQMQDCEDCPAEHHPTGPDGASHAEECHHTTGWSMAMLPDQPLPRRAGAGRALHARPSATDASPHAPERDLPPPRA